ncbi:MAG: hypothetical protein BGO78_09990 [Chloroflexi bacterium 44-23]|nr:MAG: hypothetical protein BGO78_09990 [Chloroflexi bacterium 44-23]
MNNTAETWNQRYLSTNHSLSMPRTFLMEYRHFLPKKGWALDLAMGLGHNADVLAHHGLQVIGVDFSWVALRLAKETYPRLHVVLAELPRIHFQPASFDVILNFWFLDRRLFPMMKSLLKPGGVIFFETMRYDEDVIDPIGNPDYLLKPNELKEVFGDWKTLVYEEYVRVTSHGGPQPAAHLLARKPGKT